MALALKSFLMTMNVIGSRDRTRTRTFEILAVGADEAAKRLAAQVEATALLAAWQAVSKTHVQSYRLSEVWFDDASTPTGLFNPFEEATVTCHLDVGGGVPHQGDGDAHRFHQGRLVGGEGGEILVRVRLLQGLSREPLWGLGAPETLPAHGFQHPLPVGVGSLDGVAHRHGGDGTRPRAHQLDDGVHGVGAHERPRGVVDQHGGAFLGEGGHTQRHRRRPGVPPCDGSEPVPREVSQPLGRVCHDVGREGHHDVGNAGVSREGSNGSEQHGNARDLTELLRDGGACPLPPSTGSDDDADVTRRVCHAIPTRA